MIPLLLLFVRFSWTKATAKEVSCELIFMELQFGEMGRHKTCFMDNKTSLNADGIKISSNDTSVGFIYFADNKKISFLPVDPSATFPKLIIYTATNCSLKAISHPNFRFLKELKYLYLGYNQIEKVNSDTFDDLESLERLSLSRFSP